MRIYGLLLGLAFLTGNTSFAKTTAKIPIYVNCSLTNLTSKFSCADLLTLLNSANSEQFTLVPSGSAWASVVLTDVLVAAGYVVRYSWNSNFSSTQVSDGFYDLLPLNPSAMAKDLEEAVMVGVAAGVERYRLTFHGSGTSSGSRFANGPWAISGSLVSGYLYFSGNGPTAVQTIDASTPISVQYIGDRVKFAASGNIHFQSQSQPGVDTSGNLIRNNAQNISNTESVMGLYSFKPKLSVIGTFDHTENPGDNVGKNAVGGVSVEYDQVPYRTVQTQVYAFRAGIAYNSISLFSENALLHTQEQFMTVFAIISGYFFLKEGRVVITTDLKGYGNTKYADYSTVTVDASANYLLSNAFTLSVAGSFIYRPNSLIWPLNPDYSNAAQASFYGDQPGGVWYFSAGVRVNLANILKSRRDTRGGSLSVAP